MEHDADRTFAHAEAPGHVGRLPPFEGDLLDDATLALGQRGQHLPRVDAGRGVGLDSGFGRIGIVVEVEMVVEATPAQVIDQLVARDGAQPRPSGCVSSQVWRLRWMASNASCTMSSLSPMPRPADTRPRRTMPRSQTATWPSSRR